MRPTRLLLVDDESGVLDGLRRLLRPLRGDWEVRAATSAAEALALLEEQPADVVITDMRMPGMDGGKLLALVRERHPSAVRIVLSGQADDATALRVIPLAHQFLSKPCDPDTFLDTLRRIRNALEALDDATVGGPLAGAVGWLPAAPSVCARLSEMLGDEDVAIQRLGQVIESDPALATKLLQLTNSPFFGLRRRISNVAEAVSYLGLGITRSVVVAFAASSGLPVRAPSFDGNAFQRRSMAVAQLARFVAPERARCDDSFAAGLLHDVGKLLLASALPARFEMISRAAALSGKSFEDEEQIAGGCAPHLRLGVYLMNLWGLPWPVVEAIANHRVAPTVEQKRLGPAGAVYLALQLLREAAGEESPGVDRAFVAAVGLEHELDLWRAHAKELVGA
jgi:HD-like signal output (HDOD) protein/ActR/RegA family two-component response regulator